MTDFSELPPTVGFLTDRQILQALEAGYLLEKGTWDENQLRHASYTLRLGARVELARATSAASSQVRELVIVALGPSTPRLELRPGDTALLYSLEQLRIPDSVLGFTVARGLLFAEALCPENTYVDPGFTGAIYTTVTNVSNRIVQLEYEMPLARLFFYRLCESVEKGYKTGSGLGIAQQLSSVRAVPVGSLEECRAATDAQLLESIQHIPIGGIHAAESLKRLERKHIVGQRRIITFAFVWPALLVFANKNAWINENLGPFLANVSASVIAALIMIFAPRLLAWIRGDH